MKSFGQRAIAAACMLATLTPLAGRAKAADPAIAGRYVRHKPALGELKLSPAPGGEWRIEVSAGAAPDSQGYAPADCDSVAVGPLKDGRIVAKLVPFSTENMDVDESQLKSQPGQIVVAVAGSTVTIVSSNAEQFCGMGADLTGVYAPARKKAGR